MRHQVTASVWDDTEQWVKPRGKSSSIASTPHRLFLKSVCPHFLLTSLPSRFPSCLGWLADGLLGNWPICGATTCPLPLWYPQCLVIPGQSMFSADPGLRVSEVQGPLWSGRAGEKAQTPPGAWGPCLRSRTRFPETTEKCVQNSGIQGSWSCNLLTTALGAAP